jgi:hypothetical protein
MQTKAWATRPPFLAFFARSGSFFNVHLSQTSEPPSSCFVDVLLAAALLRLQCVQRVWSAHKHIEKLRYMHRNPVKRGLVETPEQWRWSSFRAYAYGEPGLVRVNDWAVLKMKIRAA